MSRVAILIITYNSQEEIGGCLDALRDLKDVEIVVIDNASEDRTVEIVAEKKIRLVANPINAGFSAAVNQGVRAASAPLLLLLNPDAHLLTSIDAMVEVFCDRSVGAAGGMLVGLDGRPQAGFAVRRLPTPASLTLEVLGLNRVFPKNRSNWYYRCFDLDLTRKNNVEQPAGAFFMFSRAAWESTGGFDERFWPVWFEDVDFCARLKAAGYALKYVPECVAKHTGAHSIRGLEVENRARYWYGSLLKYAAKHYRPWVFRSICAAVAIGSVFRFLGSLSRTRAWVVSQYTAQSSVSQWAACLVPRGELCRRLLQLRLQINQ